MTSLPVLFSEQVLSSPDAIAVQQGDQSISYIKLNEEANQLAHHLQTIGVGKDFRVAICLERSIDLIIAILGVLKAGGAYVPLDPTYPVERLSFMLANSGAIALVTSSNLQQKFSQFNGQLICLDIEKAKIRQYNCSDPTGQVRPEDLAYVIYTSGSTGQPKGVMVEHGGWVNYTQAARQTYQLRAGERVLQFASISWDTSAEEIFPCLTSGATLVLRTEEMLNSIPQFLSNCAKWQVTVINIPTAFWHELVAQVAETGLTLPPHIRVVIIGGERANWEFLVKWRQFAPSTTHLFNTYGQTECTAVTTCAEITSDLAGGIIPLGKPVQNVSVHIFDEQLQPTPLGQSGELYVAGPGLARGYLDQPELTANKFINLPNDSKLGRLYKTGDIVREMDDGNLEFIGRVDHQLKIRGIRIEPGEIESAIARHPVINLVAVVGQPIGPNPEYLAAYVVLQKDTAITPAEIRSWLSQTLPNYLVPAVIMPLDSLPLSPNGKLDRKNLPSPDFSRSNSDTFDENLTVTQLELKRIWQEVLGLKAIGLHDDFFELGGHSLLATRVVARVRQRFNVDLPLRTMFDAPTISKLGEQILTSAQATEKLALSRRKPTDPLVASFAQESLWFLDQMVPGNPTYNISDMLKLDGNLNEKALENSINVLVERHEILRTRFVNEDGHPIPIIADSLKIPLSITQAPELPETEMEEFVRQFAADKAVVPFFLQTGPLLRTYLLKISPMEHRLIIVTHHIISDGWSIAVFFQELSVIYTNQIRGITSTAEGVLPALPLQFADYANWQHQSLQGELLDTQLNYWKEKLNNLTQLDFPLDRPRPRQKSFRGARLPIKFSPEYSHKLQIFSRNEEVTLFMVLLAGLQATLSRYTSQTDISVGTAIANRHQPELDNLIGFFVNTLVLRTNLDGAPTFHELLARVKTTTLGAYSHQAVPFELIVQTLQPRRTANRNPLFDVMLFLQNVPQAQLKFPDIKSEFVEIEQRTAEFDFVLDLTETQDGVQGFCEYDTDLFDADSMTRFVTHFQNLLANAIITPAETIDRLPMLAESERYQLLTEWNQTAHTIPTPETLPDAFETQVRLTPEKVAAIWYDQNITYAVLNEKANQLAAHLIANGVKTETVVALCLERSIDSLIAILGILKSGAIYLPLDPAYPLERLQFMLSDSQAAFLLTDNLLSDKFANFNGLIIRLGEIAEFPSTSNNPHRAINGQNACYMIYTSGSTGRPKGVIGLHLATMNRLVWMWETYPFTPNEICCQKTSLSFVDSVWEIFGPLLQGVPLAIIPNNLVKDITQFVNVLAAKKVTRIVLVPSLLRLIVESYPHLDQLLPDLRLWVCSGEALTQELAEAFVQKLPGRTLLNLYGSSEVAADSTFYEIKTGAERIGIGRPIFNTETYILDQHMQPVPVGVKGEIFIGGTGLARGYWQRPDLTSERFIHHPFKQTPEFRVYKTGDLGRYRPDGNIEYLGRADFQVKIRGIRIELEEIQNTLCEHPEVKQALVMVETSSDDQRLIAYIVRKQAQSVEQTELRKYIQERLPDTMIPTAWAFLDEFPLTPSGKIDRQVLSKLEVGRADPVKPYTAPRDELELRLVKLWEHLLEYSPIGIDDNFFEIGGHSLLVVRLMTQLEKELGKTFSLALIFHAPTIATMAAALRDQGWKPSWSSLVPIRTAGKLPPLFCVHADGGAFFYTKFANYLSPQQPFYGLQARGLDGIQPPFTNIEEMAAHYLSEIRSIQPRGPYLISGFSMGGVVIYEMARQSLAAGDPAPLVVFIDAPSPEYFEEQATSFVSKLAGLSRFSLKDGIPHIWHRISQRFRWLSDEYQSQLLLRANQPLNPALRIHRVRKLNHKISDEYQPKPYPGPITILRASEQIRHSNPDPTLGWSEFVPGKISDYVIPGDHETIFHEPNVQVMAQTLQKCINLYLESRTSD